jgi:glycosyltransferase involved in cell wall biosynthesis
MRLGRIVGEFAPDLVHLHSSKAGLAGRLALRGRVPTVFHPRGWSFLAVDGAVRAAAVRWERTAARWTDRVVCVSEAEQRLGEQAGVSARFLVVPNAIDVTDFLASSDDDRQEARRKLGLPEGPLTVCVARLSRAKGVDVLLDAWPSVLSEVPHAQLVVVGSGPDEQDLLSRQVANSRLVGHREDVPDWLAAADVVAVPSRWEGMSIGMLEAMARGRSVVSTDVPGAREAIGDAAGAVVAPEDPQALANAIAERLLDPDRPAAEGKAGRRAVEERHDYRRRSEEIAALYADIIERRAR